MNALTMEKTNDLFFNAEIGVNHNGSVDLAKSLITKAVSSGADAVKFQNFSADKLASGSTPKVDYQLQTTDRDKSHHQMLKELEFSKADFIEIYDFCTKQGIEFISTPYDCESAVFLSETLGCKKIKTASADIVDKRLHSYLAQSGKEIIISSGMSSLGEIEDCLSIYKDSDIGRISLLHCVSAYPSSDEALNLSVIPRLAELFQCRVGYSDHSKDNISAYIAAILGATIFEKHFTLDKSMAGPDHRASSTPEELKELIDNCRRVDKILGKGIKRCQDEEKQMRDISRKSLHMKKDKEAGSVINDTDLCLMRPAYGISPMEEGKVIGRRLLESKVAGTHLKWNDLI